MRHAFLCTLVLVAACGSKESPNAGVARAETSAAPAPAPSRGPEHSVFSLLDNRLLAHAQRGGGVVAVAGAAGFAKYLRFAKPKVAWKLQQTLEGHRVALAEMYASLDLPLTAEQASAA